MSLDLKKVWRSLDFLYLIDKYDLFFRFRINRINRFGTRRSEEISVLRNKHTPLGSRRAGADGGHCI